jgi:hypothetical protein
MCRVWYYLLFQACTVGPEMCLPQIRGTAIVWGNQTITQVKVKVTGLNWKEM